MLTHLLWAAVVVYAIHRLGDLAARFAPARPDAALPPAPAEVPEDLVAVANMEREPWAQEEVLRAIRERYEEVRDWNRVRAALGVGRID
ncbi:MAG: hypothetical protein ACO377_14420 [Pseudomonadales bacterium]